MKIVLQIIKHFKFVEENKKSNKFIPQTSISRSFTRLKLSFVILKKSCKNKKYIKKDPIPYHIDYYLIKHPELRQK